MRTARNPPPVLTEEERLRGLIEQLLRPVSCGEVERAQVDLQFEHTPQCAWNDNPLYAARLVRHVLEKRQQVAETFL